MAFLEEADYCSLEEYTNHIDNRAVESELKPNDLFMLMMRLKDARSEAAKAAIKIEKISEGSGLVAVKFAFLDEDLNPTSSATEKMSSGIIRNFEDSIFVDEEISKEFNIAEGYLRDYY